jgi:hypothetical protein
MYGNCNITHDLDDETPSRENGAYTKVLRHCEDLDRRLDDVIVRLDALDLEDLPAMERRVAYACKEIVGLVSEFKHTSLIFRFQRRGP